MFAIAILALVLAVGVAAGSVDEPLLPLRVALPAFAAGALSILAAATGLDTAVIVLGAVEVAYLMSCGVLMKAISLLSVLQKLNDEALPH